MVKKILEYIICVFAQDRQLDEVDTSFIATNLSQILRLSCKQHWDGILTKKSDSFTSTILPIFVCTHRKNNKSYFTARHACEIKLFFFHLPISQIDCQNVI